MKLLKCTFLPMLLLLAAAPATQRGVQTDHNFLQSAYDDARAQIRIGTMGRDLAGDPALRDLVFREVAINQKVVDKINTLDQTTAYVSIRDQLTPLNQQRITRLKNFQGLEFDQALIADQIFAHRHMIEIYQDEIRHGSNPLFRQFAQDQLPYLQDQLTSFEELSRRKLAGG